MPTIEQVVIYTRMSGLIADQVSRGTGSGCRGIIDGGSNSLQGLMVRESLVHLIVITVVIIARLRRESIAMAWTVLEFMGRGKDYTEVRREWLHEHVRYSGWN